MYTQIQDKKIHIAAEWFKLIGDPTRLKILWILLSGEYSVNELASRAGVQPAAVSQHLAKLRITNIVRARRDGNKIYYQVSDNHIRAIVNEAMSHATEV